MTALKIGAFYNPHLGRELAAAQGIDHLAMADPPRADDPWWPKIKARYTLLLHDYLGQLCEPLDERSIQRARSLAELYHTPWVAEHFQCLHTEDGTYNLNYVFPPLYTEEFLARFVTNANALKARLDQPLVMENIPGFFRSEEHTSELQSRENLVCRLLLEKKNSGGRRYTHNRARQHKQE